jgi:hypothetical protein
MATWAKELLDPKTSGVAALKLEGLGPSASESLQIALQSANPNVRFFAAEALAYLDDPAGAEALAQTAAALPKFRAYSLAALAAMEQPAAHMRLRKLMDEADIELRYGAFNALRTLDPHDPSLGQVAVLDAPATEEQPDESPDAMAVALATAANRPRPEEPFAFYIVDSEGPPIVHVARSRRSEIVVFGRNQKLVPPIVLGTGSILLNAADKDDQVELSKIVPSRFGDSDVKLRTSLELGEVIRRAANLGATYPEIVSILESADRQKNLPGPLVVDAVPTAKADYFQAAIMGVDSAKPDPAVKRTTAQASGSRLRRLFGLGNREREMADKGSAKPAANQDATSTVSADTSKAKNGQADPSADKSVATSDLSNSGGTTGAVAGSGTGTAGPASNPKKDDSVQKAGGDSASPPRSRLLDWLRRRSDD